MVLARCDGVTRRTRRRQTGRRGIDVEVEDSAVALLQRRGFDPVYGARGLRRTIRNVLADPVAAAVLDLRPVGTQPLALQARAVGDQIQVKKVP